MIRLCAFADEADKMVDGQIAALKRNNIGLIELRGLDGVNIGKLSEDEAYGLDGYDLFELVARKRGMLMSGGAVNSSRCAEMLLDEFRGAVIGKISLESPDDVK